MLNRILISLFLTGLSSVSYCQTPTDSLPNDPGSVAVHSVQNMTFGAFSHGASGGTIIISTDGSRNATGTVNTFNMGVPFYQAIFELEAPAGSVISILNGPDVILTGSNGGSMSLHIGGSTPVSPFNVTVSPPQKMEVMIGGTLTVGNALSNPPGNYIGNVYITFNQQ